MAMACTGAHPNPPRPVPASPVPYVRDGRERAAIGSEVRGTSKLPWLNHQGGQPGPRARFAVMGVVLNQMLTAEKIGKILP